VTTPVILDCDPGHDDAIALLLALASPEIELVGVTTTHGNQTLDKTTDNALRLLALVDRTDVPVAVGAERPLVRELHVAAHVHGESGLDAAQRVFHSGLDVTMIGLDVTHDALLTPALADRFREAGRVGTFVAELVDFFKQYHARTYGWDGAPVHDAVALAHAFRPGIVTTERLNVEVELESELTRGRTVVDRWHRTDREPNAEVGVGVDADAFFELLLERIATYG